jgi:hypothetical protein
MAVAPPIDVLVDTLPSQAFSAVVAFTRPNDTAIYAANDVVGHSLTGPALLTFPNMGPPGKEILITSTALERDVTAIIAGETSYRLYLYNTNNLVSNYVDNNAWDLANGDRSAYIGYVDLGTLVDLGSTLYVELNGINKQVKLGASGALYGYLITIGTYTPAALTVSQVTLHSLAV